MDNTTRKAAVPLSKVGNSSSDKGVQNICDFSNNGVKIRVRPMLQQQGSSSNVKMLRDCQSLVQNHANFRKSGEPGRVMYYDSTGSWVDYPPEVVALMRRSFRDGKGISEVSMQGRNCLVDFYRMLEVDFDTGFEKSISWIDVNDQCFFPQIFVNSCEEVLESNGNGRFEGAFSDEHRLTVAIQVKVVGDDLENQKNLSKRKRKPETGDIEVDQVIKVGKSEGSCCNIKDTGPIRPQLGVTGRHRLGVTSNKMVLPPGAKRHQLGVMNGREIMLPRWPQTRANGREMVVPRWPEDMRVLREGDRNYELVKNLFLAGLGRVEPAVTITGIQQCPNIGSFERKRQAAFNELMNAVKKARGDSNIAVAWYGTSAKEVELILTRGFRMPDEPHRSRPYGVGVHLSPIQYSQSSAILSGADANGEKHVILCRVLLGKAEKVAAANQMMPSSPAFDTGVDDVNSPRWYVVWHANMKTHIIPEVVVSFKGANHVQGMTVPELIGRLGRSLPPPKVQELQTLLGLWKEDKVEKDEFMHRLNSVVGKEMVDAVVDETRCSSVFYGWTTRRSRPAHIRSMESRSRGCKFGESDSPSSHTEVSPLTAL